MVIRGFAIYVCSYGCLQICLKNGGTGEGWGAEPPGLLSGSKCCRCWDGSRTLLKQTGCVCHRGAVWP